MIAKRACLPAVLLALIWAGSAMAQPLPEEQLEQEEEEQEQQRIFGELDPDDVAIFAEVYPKIRELDREFAESLRELDHADHDAARELQKEMVEKRQQLLDEHNISTETYNRIRESMAQNEALREHLEEITDGEIQA